MKSLSGFHFNVNHVGLAATIASIAVFFAALALAFGLRIGETPVWQRFEVPLLLWLSTVVLILSSSTLETAKYSLRRGHVESYRTWVAATVACAAVFLVLQLGSAWQLVAQNVAASSNPHGSAFYCFIALHGLHLAIGFVWLGLLFVRSRSLLGAAENDLRRHRVVAGVASLYWHFMGGLWLVLFALLLWWSR